MSMLKDFVKFFGAMLAGQQNASAKFLESLSSSERYIRWGDEREDQRDFITALGMAESCNDADAPKAEVLPRKYNAMCNSAIGAIRLMIKRHQSNTQNIMEAKRQLQNEARTVAELLKKSMANIQRLKSEGSLIKAKDEEKHTEELKVKLMSLKKQVDTAESDLQVTTGFGNLITEAEEILRRVETALAGLTMNQELPSATVSSIQQQIGKRLSEIRAELQALQNG